LAFWIGRQADRHGIRPLVLTGFALGALGLLAFGRSTKPWQIVVVSWVLLGPAGGLVFYEPAFVAVDQWYSARHRARALAVLTLVGGLAGPLFLPGTEFLVSRMGWRDATAVLAALMAAAGVADALVLPRRRQQPARGEAPKVRARLRLDRRFVFFTGAMALSFAGFQSVFFHRIAAFEETGFAVASVTAWAAMSSLLSFPGRYLGPYLAVRTNPTSLYAGTVLVAGLATMLMAGSAAWMMPTHFAVFGVAFGALLPIRAVAMAGWFSGPDYGRVMGAQWSIAAVGGASAPMVVGVLRDRTGEYGPILLGVGAVFLCSALVSALSGSASRHR
jgi:MFS family permease